MHNRRAFMKGAAAAAALAPFNGAAARAPQAAQPETILIVGAGLAGLVAAHRLRDAGKRVIVIEARDAPGGRVRTERGAFGGGLYGELGAARVAETHEYVLHWVNDLNLSLIPFAPESGSQILAVGQTRARADDFMARDRLAPGLHADERKLSLPGLLVKYIEGVPEQLGDGDVELRDPRWRSYDQMTWPQWLA